MEVSTGRSSFLISVLISALLIQHFSVVQCSKGNGEKKSLKATPVYKKVSRKAAPAMKKVAPVTKVKPVPVVKKPALEAKWCIPKPESSAETLQNNIDFACGKGGIDCKPIRAGGTCFEPNNAWSHAAYVMNAFYQSTDQKDCHFASSGIVTKTDPMKGGMCFANQGQVRERDSSTPAQKATRVAAGKPKPTPAGSVKKYCIPKPGTSGGAMQNNLDFACAKVDCKPIQPGGECYEPNTAEAHAAWAMNYYYQMSDRRECDFSNTGWVTNQDPSSGRCQFPA